MILLDDVGLTKKSFLSCYSEIDSEYIQFLNSEDYKYELAEEYVVIAERKLSDAYLSNTKEFVNYDKINFTEEYIIEAENYINLLEDGDLKTYLQNRIDTIRQRWNDLIKVISDKINGNNSDYDNNNTNNGKVTPPSRFAPSDTKNCSTKTVVLSNEPDPSCTMVIWNNVLNVDNFIFPMQNGKKLGAWPKDYSNYSQKLSSPKKYSSGKLIWPTTPTNGKYSFVYDHNGIDIMANFGTPVYSPVSGTLSYSEWGHTTNKGSDETAYSITIIMDDPIVYNGTKYNTIFLTHLSGIVTNCSSTSNCNKKIEQGELIGFVGNAAGDAETSGWVPHLHMTIHPSGNYSGGLRTLDIQKIYNLTCGTTCSDVIKKAGG